MVNNVSAIVLGQMVNICRNDPLGEVQKKTRFFLCVFWGVVLVGQENNERRKSLELSGQSWD